MCCQSLEHKLNEARTQVLDMGSTRDIISYISHVRIVF